MVEMPGGAPDWGQPPGQHPPPPDPPEPFAPGQHPLEQNPSQPSLPEQDLPEQDLPEQDLPEQDLPELRPPEQYVPGQYSPEQSPYPALAAAPAFRTRRRVLRVAVAAVVAAGCAVAAVMTGDIAHTELTRAPRPSELAAAAALGLAQRWERLSAGTMFPPRIGYSTDLLTQETATRVGIGLASSCASAVDQTLTALAAQYGCRAAVRASYIDGLGGAVYTIGVLAFPTSSASASFYAAMPASLFPATGLRALTLAGTSAGRFDDAARQASVSQRTGPYIVVVVAGYADGRAASATGERRSSVFAAGSALLGAVTAPLSAPEVVNCRMKAEWSC